MTTTNNIKTGVIFSALILTAFYVQSSIYDIQVEKLDGNMISMAAYNNKKIIITAFSASNPNARQLQYLDSLQIVDSSIQIIGIPAFDLGGYSDTTKLIALSNSLSPKFVITKTGLVKKEAGNNQQALFNWLTHANENNHFDTDVDTVGQLFFVSKNGILYSILGNEVPQQILLEVLNQTINQ